MSNSAIKFNSEFVKEINETVKEGKFIKVKDFAEEYGLKE